MAYPPVLLHVEILYELRDEHLQQIADLGTNKTYNKGDVVFEENTDSDELYIILEGEVDIQVDPRTLGIASPDLPEPKTIATLRRAQSFGEVALVDEGVRSASAICASDETILMVINRNELIELCRADFELGYLLMRNVAADLALKIRQTDLMIREQLLWKPHK